MVAQESLHHFLERWLLMVEVVAGVQEVIMEQRQLVVVSQTASARAQSIPAVVVPTVTVAQSVIPIPVVPEVLESSLLSTRTTVAHPDIAHQTQSPQLCR
jgi:hypothetical protein